MKKRNFACLLLLASTTLVACGGNDFKETSKEKVLEVVEKDSKKEIAYKSAKVAATLKKFETQVPAEMLTSAGMTQEQFDATLLAEMQLEVGKAVEETIEGEELADLRFTVEDVSSMPEGTKYYVAGDKFKIESALKEGDQDVKATYEFNEYGYMTYGLNDVKMTMDIGFELKVTMVTESKVTYTK